MNRWVWFILGGFILAGLLIVLKTNIVPKPVRLVKPSLFNTPEEIGVLIWSRFGPRFLNEPNIVLGLQSDREEQVRVVKAFINSATAAGLNFKIRAKETRVELEAWPEAKSWTDLDLKRTNDLLKDQLITPGHLILLPSTFTSDAIGGTPLSLVERQLKKKVMTLTFVNYATSRKGLENLQPVCDGQAVFGEKTVAALGCAAKRKSLASFRKRLDQKRYSMAMEQTGEKGYQIYISAPLEN